MSPIECEHGSLARSCNICDMEQEIASLKAKLAEAGQWTDPNDKTQKQFLPHIGERVLFCHAGKTYYGKHTGGSFISFTNPGKNYPTWECFWMYPPAASGTPCTS